MYFFPHLIRGEYYILFTLNLPEVTRLLKKKKQNKTVRNRDEERAMGKQEIRQPSVASAACQEMFIFIHSFRDSYGFRPQLAELCQKSWLGGFREWYISCLISRTPDAALICPPSQMIGFSSCCIHYGGQLRATDHTANRNERRKTDTRAKFKNKNYIRTNVCPVCFLFQQRALLEKAGFQVLNC